MPVVVRVGSFKVVIFTDDHPPAHVHVVRGRSAIRILLGNNEVILDQIHGRPKRADVMRAKKIVLDHLADCWRAWRKYYGQNLGV